MSESKKTLKVALVQMQSGFEIEQNFQQAIFFLKEAVEKHSAELIIYPENFLCLGCSSYLERSSEINTFVDRLKSEAKEQGVAVLFGSLPALHNDKCFSRSMLVNKQSELIGFYDKIHLFDVQVKEKESKGNGSERIYRESDSFIPGSITKVLRLDAFQIGMSICYDLRFPELYQLLRKQGAELITVPSAFTYKTGQEHWEILLRARAIETQCFVLAANQCGLHKLENKDENRRTWGHSMIVDPWGKILCQLGNTPGVCAATLDFSELKRVRQSMDLMAHKRLL